MDIQRVSNVNLVLDYMKEFKITRLVSNKDSVLGAGDIVGKNKSLVLGLIWSVYLHFVALELHGLNDLQDVKSKILDWVRIFTDKVSDLNVSNFTTDFKDGRVFLAIREIYYPYAYSLGSWLNSFQIVLVILQCRWWHPTLCQRYHRHRLHKSKRPKI